jgi:hypothetical protein
MLVDINQVSSWTPLYMHETLLPIPVLLLTCFP